MYIYDLDKIKNVLLGVIKGIEQNKWTLNKAIEEDKKIGYTEDLDKIKESINSYLNYNPQLTIQDIKNQSMDGYGNIAIIDFEGFNDGVAFEGGKGTNYSLEIGSNTFIPGFEEQLIGMEKNEEKEIFRKYEKNIINSYRRYNRIETNTGWSCSINGC